jgi:iron(III) transport system ATP-binding protein
MTAFQLDRLQRASRGAASRDAAAVDAAPGDAAPPRAVVGAPPEALALDGVTHAYGRVLAVSDATLTVGAGEIVCLVGPSGCGKSTLLRLAAGLEELQSGEVRIAGRRVATPGDEAAPERRGIGIVFQDYALFPHLSVLDNVRFGLSRLPQRERRERAAACLEQVGMASYADAFPHALSGGQQQRVALARALAPEPAVLLLDEPFSGLDARLREQVRDETLHVLKAAGAATLLVTHDPEEAMFLADRIALMRAGRIVQLGTPTDLYMRPIDAYAASFFGEVNRLPGTVRGGHVETPLGRLCAPDAPEGAEVEVLIRPEGLSVLPPNEPLARLPVLARVETARLLGRTSLVHLSLPGPDGRALHLHARVPGLHLPAEDSHVAVTLDRRQAFVFPRPDPT